MSEPIENADLAALVGEAVAADRAAQPTPEPEADTQGQPQPGAPAAPVMSPEDEAEKIVGLIAWAVEKVFPMLGYTDETKKEGAKKLAPLLVKYDVANTIFAKWGAEFEAGAFFAGVAYASYMAVKNVPKEQRESSGAGWWRKLFAASK